MSNVMTRETHQVDLKEVVNKLIPDSIGKDIEKKCQLIFPLENVNVRRVKVLKKPNFDVSKLMEFHGEGQSGTSTGVQRGGGSYVPPVQ